MSGEPFLLDALRRQIISRMCLATRPTATEIELFFRGGSFEKKTLLGAFMQIMQIMGDHVVMLNVNCSEVRRKGRGFITCIVGTSRNDDIRELLGLE